jgi:hypothetical protein
VIRRDSAQTDEEERELIELAIAESKRVMELTKVAPTQLRTKIEVVKYVAWNET